MIEVNLKNTHFDSGVDPGCLIKRRGPTLWLGSALSITIDKYCINLTYHTKVMLHRKMNDYRYIAIYDKMLLEDLIS